MDYEIEELENLPKEWIDLLNSMPQVRDEFIDDKLCNEDEMISPYFFSYFSDDYLKCKPYFLCFERGEDVFNNFFNLYGKNEPIKKDIDDITLKELIVKHMEGINNIFRLSNQKTYNIAEMKIEESTYECIKKEYDLNNIESIDIKDRCADAMWHDILPNEDENPISAFDEALYNETLDYNIVYYILWPLGKIDYINNPYEAYVKLKQKGVKLYIINRNLVKYTIEQ